MFRVLVIVLVVGSLLPIPVSAQESLRMTVLPLEAVASQPTRLLITGDLSFFAYADPEDRVVTFETGRIRVAQRGEAFDPPFTNPFDILVDLGNVPEGSYDVEVVLEDVSSLPSASSRVKSTWDLGRLEVAAGFVLQAPDTALSSRQVRVDVSRVDFCASLGEATVTPNGGVGGTVSIPWNTGCIIAVPGDDVQLRELETLLDPLDPGLWDIEVVFEGRRVAHRQIEVLPDPVTLQEGRFELKVTWFNNLAADVAFPVNAPTKDSALFAFFNAANWEVMAKVLDGCDINGHYWVFAAANTDQGYELLVTDTTTNQEWSFVNELGTASPAATDIEAFPCR